MKICISVPEQMDKASIIGDTISYLRELNRQIEELEKLEVLQKTESSGVERAPTDGEPQPLDSSEQTEKSCRFSCLQESDELERPQVEAVSVLSSNPNRVGDHENLTNSVKSSKPTVLHHAGDLLISIVNVL